ncbi:MAG TPA: exosortase H [Xanthomonadales bacterium]|nr:exosortase H [Xanthomonadales bacterium]
MVRFTILFLVLLCGLAVLYFLNPVERWVVDPFTSGVAKVSTTLIHMFDGDAISYGKVIQSKANGFAVSIERGCNGMEAVIILFAAIFAFPAPWKHRLVGFGLGFLAIQALNMVRIISLFYLGQWNQVWFDWFHLYIWQALIILDALVVWLLWLRWLPLDDEDEGDEPGAPAAA